MSEKITRPFESTNSNKIVLPLRNKGNILSSKEMKNIMNKMKDYKK